MKKTRATETLPEIEWEQGELCDTDDHVKEYNCTGESADGRKWIGSWIECDGEFADIERIEEE